MEGSREQPSPASSLAGGESPERDRRVLLPVTSGVGERSVRIARDLSAATRAELFLLDADAGVLERGDTDAPLETRLENLRERAVAPHGAGDVPSDADPVSTVVQAVASHGVDLLVVDADAGTTNRIRGPAPRRMSEHVDCDSLVVTENNPPPSIASVLVPVADGTNARTAVDVAAAIARENDAWIELMHVVPDDDERAAGQSIVDHYQDYVANDVDTQTWVLDADDTGDCIVEQTGHYDLTVVGGSHTSRLMTFVFSSVSRDVADNADGTVLEAYRGTRDLFGE